MQVTNTIEELCVEVIGKCLMNCMHCSSSCSAENKDILSLDEITALIEESKELGVRIFEVSGGEPLLHPDLDQIVKEASKHFEVRLYTSGYTGSSNGVSKERFSELKSEGVHKVVFNMQGSTAQTHQKLSKTFGSFNSLINSIRNAKEAGLPVSVHFVPTKFNYKELRDTAELCSNLGVEELAVLRFVSQGRGELNRDSLELTQGEFEELLNDVVKLKKEYKNRLRIRTGCPMNFCSLIDRDISTVHCKAGRETILIGYDGRITPCPAFKNTPEFIAGNIRNASLSELLRDNAVLTMLSEYDHNRISGECSSCEDIDYCKGRCIAQRYYKYKDIYKGPDPLCPRRKVKVKVASASACASG